MRWPYLQTYNNKRMCVIRKFYSAMIRIKERNFSGPVSYKKKRCDNVHINEHFSERCKT